jgi:hypothetical protein
MRRIALIALAVALAATVVSVAVAAPAQGPRPQSKAPRVGIGPATALGPATAISKPDKQRPGSSKPGKQSGGSGGSTSSAGALFSDSFDRPDGLITNEYATWNPNSPQAVKSADWQMTSGSLFAQGGAGSTGVPDGCSSASPSSSPCTASAVFRLNSARHDFGDVTVSTDLRVQRLVSTSRTPAVAWDGVHVWLRYQSEESLYYASFARRDGRIVVKKKCPGGSENGGTYYELAPGEVSGFPIPFGAVQHLAAGVVNNADGSVTVTMQRDGATILTATDRGLGCAPITAPGAVGIRGDNAEFSFDEFAVSRR